MDRLDRTIATKNNNKMVKIGKLLKKAKDDGNSLRNFVAKKAASPANTPSDTPEGDAGAVHVTSPNETRDEPSPTNVPADPSGRDDIDDMVAGSASDEQSYDEESMGHSDDVSNAEGTVESYEEELSQGSDGDEEESVDYDETTASSVISNQKSIETAKGLNVTKKYFHKDVVVNSLEDGVNNLVIRAMYFIPKPKGEDHVVVKIEASTISPRDCMKCKGSGLTKAQLPFVPGYELVGTVQTLGDKAKMEGQFREGDRVAAVSNFGGGNSRFISIPAGRLTKIPSNVKSTRAVCMIHDYMAALRALRLAKKGGSPFTGMNVLVTDGLAPVGQAVIALANMEGANIYCCADESKHAYLASLGAKCFVKNPESWLPTAAGTFDVVIDNSCVDSYSSSWFALTKKGTLVCIAPVYTLNNDELPLAACGLVELTELQHKWAGLKAQYMMSQTSFLNTTTMYDDDTEQYKQDLRYLMFLLERGDIKPKVAERVSLDDVPDAQRLMQSGRANGTVVCVPWIEE